MVKNSSTGRLLTVIYRFLDADKREQRWFAAAEAPDGISL